MTLALPLTDRAAVDRLGDDLRVAGYTTDAVLQLLGPAAHEAMGRREPAAALRATADRSALSTLVRLFLLGTEESAEQVAGALPGLGVAAALAAGVLERRAGAVRAALDVRPHAGPGTEYILISDLGSDVRPGPMRPDHVLGLGSASVTLARAVVRAPVDAALDLGTGCGVQALHLAAHSAAVVATDTNRRALALAAATARINGQSWDLREGSLFEPIRTETFDLVVSNPPFVIGPGDRRYSYRDSGVAGDGACRQLVEGMLHHLRPNGIAHMLANWMILGDDDWRSRVGEWVDTAGCDAWVVQRDVADPASYVGLWLADAGETGSTAISLAEQWLAYLDAAGVTGIGLGIITLRRTDTRPSVTLDEILEPDCDLTGDEIAGFLSRRSYVEHASDRDLLASRLRLADSVTLESRAVPGHDGWATVLRLLRRRRGPGASVQLDEWGQALLAGCTGDVPLGAQFALLAAAHGVPEDALVAALLPSVRAAVIRGLLTPVNH